MDSIRNESTEVRHHNIPSREEPTQYVHITTRVILRILEIAVCNSWKLFPLKLHAYIEEDAQDQLELERLPLPEKETIRSIAINSWHCLLHVEDMYGTILHTDLMADNVCRIRVFASVDWVMTWTGRKVWPLIFLRLTCKDLNIVSESQRSKSILPQLIADAYGPQCDSLTHCHFLPLCLTLLPLHCS